MGKIITILDDLKEPVKVEMLCAFNVPELENKYIIYSKGEYDSYGNTIIYAGKIVNTDDKQVIENIEMGYEWEIMKGILKNIAKHSLESGDL